MSDLDKIRGLEWFEEAELICKYHKSKGGTIQDTADDLGISYGKVQQSIVLAENMTDDLKLMDKKSALESLRKREQC